MNWTPTPTQEQTEAAATAPVAVYGSLLSGFGNHIRYLSNAEFVGNDKTAADFDFVSLGGFPAALDDGQTAITVELYNVTADELAALDALEGCPRMYRRELVTLASGLRAWIYVGPEGFGRGRNRIASGSWREYTEHDSSRWY